MSAPVIAEDQAWEIADTFAAESREILGVHLMAVVAVGSLPAGSYVPGRSDIDLVVVARDACPEGLLSEIKEMANRYWVKYGFSKGFGGYGIHECDLSPPFGRLHDMVYEILQLKQQGRVILGHLDLSAIPDPSEADMKRSLADLVPDLHGAWSRDFPTPIDVADARVNTIIYWLRILVWDRTGEYVLGKRNVLPAFSNLPGNDSILKMLTPIRLYLDQETDHPGDVTRFCREVGSFVLGEVEWVRRAASD